MIRFLSLLILFLNISVQNGVTEKQDESYLYYPLHIGNTWYFKAYKKKWKKKRWVYLKAEILEPEKGEEAYFFISAPKVDINYLVCRTEKGVFMKISRYPVPLFEYSIDIRFSPDVPILKFPLSISKEWQYEGEASADVLNLFKIVRTVKAIVKVHKKERSSTDIGYIECYRIKSQIDKDDGKGFQISQYWWGKNIGYVRADTVNHYAELVGYRIYSKKKKMFIEKYSEKTKEIFNLR